MKLIKKKMKVWRTRSERLENREPVGWRLAASFLPFCSVSRRLGFHKLEQWQRLGEDEGCGQETGWMLGPAWLAAVHPPLKLGAANPVREMFIALCPLGPGCEVARH